MKISILPVQSYANVTSIKTRLDFATLQNTMLLFTLHEQVLALLWCCAGWQLCVVHIEPEHEHSAGNVTKTDNYCAERHSKRERKIVTQWDTHPMYNNITTREKKKPQPWPVIRKYWCNSCASQFDLHLIENDVWCKQRNNDGIMCVLFYTTSIFSGDTLISSMHKGFILVLHCDTYTHTHIQTMCIRIPMTF